MAEIRNGVVTQVMAGGAQAVIRPYGLGQSVTPPLPVQNITVKIPAHESHGEQHPEQIVQVLHPALVVGDKVAFVLYEDGTGLIIGKTGGGMIG